MTVYGQDWASYQSYTPSTKGIDFVFIKATEGTGYVNPRMCVQTSHARKAGLVVGFYHFLRPGNMKAQAKYFVTKAASIEGDPLWCDWEDPGVSCHDKDTFIKEVIRLRGATHRVGLYCNTNYWWTRDTTSYCGDSLWIATYNGKPGHPGVRHDWDFHQYTSTPVDKNYGAFKDRAALREWCSKKTAKTPDTKTKEVTNVSFDLNTNLSVNQWIKDRWADDKALQNGIWVQTALSSGYGHARRAGDASEAALAELKAMRATIDKLVDAVGAAGNFDPADLKAEIRKAVADAVESVSFTPSVDE